MLAVLFIVGTNCTKKFDGVFTCVMFTLYVWPIFSFTILRLILAIKFLLRKVKINYYLLSGGSIEEIKFFF